MSHLELSIPQSLAFGILTSLGSLSESPSTAKESVYDGGG